MNKPPPSTLVTGAHAASWRDTALTIRYLAQMLSRLSDPAPGSELAGDDAAVTGHGEYPSDATRAQLDAAMENLSLWANVVSPMLFIDGVEVKNPPRPYFTLARAGLESAASAAWVLSPQDPSERADRHMRLVLEDLDQMRKALCLSDAAQADAVQLRIDAARQAHPRAIQSAPSYVAMVRDAALRAGWDANGAEELWRMASAAAHGKRWFTGATHHTILGEEFSPGRHRAVHFPDPDKITEMVALATKVADWAVIRYGELAGAPLDELHRQCMQALQNNMPRSVQVPDLT